MLTALSYGDGKLQDIADLEEISDHIADKRKIVWMDLACPTHSEIMLLETEFGFHKLSVEDVMRGHQRPKLDEYEGYHFVVMYSANYRPSDATGEGGLQTFEVDIFMGENFVVTVHHSPVPELEEAIRRWRTNPDMVRDGNIGFLLYTICDSIVDHYFPVMDAIEDEIDKLEERVFVSFSKETIADIFDLRKDLLTLRKVVAPQRDVFNILTRRDMPILNGKNAVYFADIYDHLLRITDMIETYRDLLTGALDGYLSMTSNNLNEIMKVLTSASIILMSVSAITGFYGMNFRYMPELLWPIGEFWALGLMVVVGVLLFIYFRRRSWL